MGKIRQIREFIWPLLEKGDSSSTETLQKLEFNKNLDRDDLKLIYDQALKKLEAEEDRKKIVENKSTIFIGTIGIITSVIIGVTSLLIKEQKVDDFMMVMVFLLFLFTTYMLRTVWFAIRALERKAYYNLSLKDLTLLSSNDYYKNVIQQINSILLKNYPTTNSKVDNMTMAQEYFKRGIVVLVFFALVIFLFFVNRYGLLKWFTSKSQWNIYENISFSNTLILYLICSVLFIIIFLMFIKLRKLNKMIKTEYNHSRKRK